MVALLTSCNHKQLEYGDSADVSIRFDWSREPAATPQQMRLVVFRTDAQMLQLPFDKEGGTTTLVSGNYGFIAYNSESEVISATGSAYNDFQLTANTTTLTRFSSMFVSHRAPMALGTENQPIVFCPDELWTSAQQVSLGGGTTMVTMPMQAATVEYVFVIRNVQNLSTVRELTATLSGMSSSWIPTKGHCSATHCIMPFEVETDGVSTITARVRCFGHCPDDDTSAHKLVIYAMLEDQSKWYYTFDVTEAMHDGNHHDQQGEGGSPEVPIELDNLPLPAPVPAEGMGLSPQVDGWNEVTIEKPM